MIEVCLTSGNNPDAVATVHNLTMSPENVGQVLEALGRLSLIGRTLDRDLIGMQRRHPRTFGLNLPPRLVEERRHPDPGTRSLFARGQLHIASKGSPPVVVIDDYPAEVTATIRDAFCAEALHRGDPDTHLVEFARLFTVVDYAAQANPAGGGE